MRKSLLLAAMAATAILGACKEASGPLQETPTVAFTATMKGDNTCEATFNGKTYSSVGHIKGALMPAFTDTLDSYYHGFVCWMSVDGGHTREGGDAEARILFSGANNGQPLEAGTYTLRNELLLETPRKTATIIFFNSDSPGDRWRVRDDAPGNITVEETAGGGRTVRVDTRLVRWSMGL